MSDTETNTPAANKVNWKAIITDMVIIVAIMAVLAYGCNLLMKPFESVSPTDSLVSLIRKGDNNGGTKDTAFLKELEEGMKLNAEFVNTQDNTGRTPLMWAAYANFNSPIPALKKDLERLYYVRTLLATPGIKADLADKDGFTALHWASWSGMPLCTLLLADAGLDINHQDANGYTPLMLAAMRGNDEVASILLALGAKTELTNVKGETAAQLAGNSESAYNKRASWMYTLIFSKYREAAYQCTLQLQKMRPEPATAAELMAKLATPEAIQSRRNSLDIMEALEKTEEGGVEEAPSDTPAAEDEGATADPV